MEKREIVLASVVLLIHPIAVLIPGAITLAFTDSLSGISNPIFHGISQVMYEYASAANNGSGFEGLADSQPAPTGLWWNLSTCFSLLLGRYVPIIALLLLADSMTNKQLVPETTGTLRTDSVLFTSVTAGVIIILGALTFFPVLVGFRANCRRI
ncbi:MULTISPECIES: potassium-transporting ATPase subunit KdpA [unclassified Microcoleus]|uniref:potassium-transporting ATPase subunit KdpA n=1 Tax=unclassified Microcoleus TaxID=2642155 RepID=UPI002FCEB9A5